jgi:nicotinamide phosphoribosyltransferase
MIRTYAGGVVSIVSDSYNIFEACKAFGNELKQDVIDNGVTLVVRPDSGNPAHVVTQCLKLLEEGFGSTVNSKGYRVLNNGVRVLQGDGITGETIGNILALATANGFSADNILFGQGGALLQGVTRDTQRWAMKCSAIRVNGEWRRVFKDPVTDPGKSSKSGRVTLYKENGKFYSGVEDWPRSELVTVFEDGKLYNEWTWDAIRERAKSS